MNISTVPIHDNNERYLAISVAAEMEGQQETRSMGGKNEGKKVVTKRTFPPFFF